MIALETVGNYSELYHAHPTDAKRSLGTSKNEKGLATIIKYIGALEYPYGHNYVLVAQGVIDG